MRLAVYFPCMDLRMLWRLAFTSLNSISCSLCKSAMLQEMSVSFPLCLC